MLNFFHNIGIGIVSAFMAFVGVFQAQPAPAIQNTIIQNTSTTSQQVSTSTQADKIESKTTTATKPVIHTSSNTDNSAAIQAEIQSQVQAALKIKQDQDALIAKQKAEEQAKIEAQNAANLATQERAKESDAIQSAKAQQEALQASQRDAAKRDALNAINLKIANLNAKYSRDLEAINNNSGMSTGQRGVQMKVVTDQYNIDYNLLMSEFQQVQYTK